MGAGGEPGTLSPETGSEPWGSADPREKTVLTSLWLGIVQLINILIGFRHPGLLRAPVINAGRQHGASGWREAETLSPSSHSVFTGTLGQASK